MNEKDKAILQAMASIQNRLRHVYNQGFEDGRKAERKTGKWIDVSVKAGESDYRCTECGKLARNFITGLDDWWCYTAPKYCPNCGAKMEVDDGRENDGI